MYFVLYISNTLLGVFNFLDGVLQIWFSRFHLVEFPRYKIGSVDFVWYVGFGKLGSVAS